MLTESEYLDQKRFPLTTQVPPISLNGQHMIDAINHDDLLELGQLTPEQSAILAELKAKLAQVPPSDDPPAPAPPKPAEDPKKGMQLTLGRPKSDSKEDREAFADEVVAAIRKQVEESPAPAG